MKKTFLKQSTAIVLLFVGVCGGCTKDTILSMPDNDTPSILKKKSLGKAPNFADQYKDDQKYGSIKGIMLPIEAEPRIFLTGNASMEFSLDSSGMILVQVPAGEYAVEIVPANNYYSAYIISNVFVYTDSITNLGTITLPFADYIGGDSGCQIGWGRLKNK